MEKDYLEGAVLSVWNARALFESACSIEKAGHHGGAASLFVLSGEESAKGLALYFRSKPTDSEVNRKIFSDHRFKHSQGVHYMSIFLSLMQFRGSRMVCGDRKECSMHVDTCPLLGKFAAWERTADTVKKRGFYVDRVNDRWHNPLEMGLDDARDIKFCSEYALQWAESFVLFEPLPKHHKARRKPASKRRKVTDHALVAPSASSAA